MSSLAKAAVISALVFVAILVAVVFLANNGGPPVVDPTPPGPAETPDPPTPGKKVEKSKVFEAPVDTASVQLTVEVVEKGRGRRLPNSRVRVLESGPMDKPGRAVWESDKQSGGFVETALKPGAYQVRAQCPRFKGEVRSLILIEGNPQKLLFELERGRCVNGKVLAADGTPIEGARVSALEELGGPGDDLEKILIEFINIQNMTNEVAAEDVSASDGSYSLCGLGVKYYTIRAVAPGFAPGKVEQVPAPREQVDIQLSEGAEIGGTVVDSTGAAVPDANVYAYPHLESQNVFDIILSKARPPMDSAVTDPGGQFRFETLGAGVYNFLVESPGYQAGRFMEIAVGPGGQSSLAFTVEPGLVISGLVRGPNDEPVEGARVRANLIGGGQGRRDEPSISFDDGSVFTDEQGNFVFNTLEEGSYTIICWHADYESLQRRDVRPPQQDLLLKLSWGGRIRGTVTDGLRGEPISGARVSAGDVADLRKESVTQDDGTFVLSGLQAGTRPVRVTVTAKGYARVNQDVQIQQGVPVEQDFALQPTGRIFGVVVNSNGDPVPNAQVMARRAQTGSSVETTVGNTATDNEGRFLMSDVEAGTDTWIRVKVARYLDGFSEAFSVQPLEEVELPPIVLDLGGSVGGKVTGPDGQPVSGAMVSVMREGDTELNIGLNPSSPTNARGEYEINGLPSGTVDLVVKAPHLMEKKVPGVEIREGALNTIDISLEQGNSIAGVVIDQVGNPVAGARISVRDFGMGMKELNGSSGRDGSFTIEGIVAEDSVEITVSHQEFGTYNDPRVPVGTTDLVVQLKGLAVLRGQVVAADGAPVSSFSVQPEATNPGTAVGKKLDPKTYTTVDGSFEYKGVPSGVYAIRVRAPDYALTSINDVQVTEGVELDLGRIVLEMGGLIFGTVVDSTTQRPVAGARVRIVQGASRFVRRGAGSLGGAPSPTQSTDANGRFRFENLKGGTLTLRVSHTGYVTQDVPNVNPDVVSTSQGLVVALEAGGEIRGTVLDPGGAPLSDMTVYLIGQDSAKNQQVKTDQRGKFQFFGVPSGAFTVKAHRFGVSGESRTVQGEQAVEMVPGARREVVIPVE